MLSRAHRLSRQKDFDAVFQRGALVQDEFLVIRFSSNRRAISRFGLVISAKTAKKAVVRNRLKRQLNEIIRARLGNIISGKDFVLVAKPKLAGQNYREIEVIFLSLLKKKNLYV